MTEYLTGKRTIDDRALDRRVLDQFASALADAAETAPERPVEITEAGAGTGTMVARLVEWDLLPDRVAYTGIDRDEERVASAREHVPEWLANAGYEVQRTETGFRARDGDRELAVSFETADVFDRSGRADAVVACAFCDLIELPAGVEKLLELTRPGGVVYAPITYDGRTRFVPEDPFDETVESLYHEHMATGRDAPGSPHAGRRLLEAARASDADVIGVGGSDWISRPVDGAYPGDERLVIAHLLETIVRSVREVSDGLSPQLDEWRRRRETALDNGELVYVAHNLDLLLERPK